MTSVDLRLNILEKQKEFIFLSNFYLIITLLVFECVFGYYCMTQKAVFRICIEHFKGPFQSVLQFSLLL